MSNILDIKSAVGSYTFYFKEKGKEKYFCKCGNHFEIKVNEDEKTFEDDFSSEDDDDLLEVINSAKISLREDIKCPHCNTNYKLPQNQKLLKKSKLYFSISYVNY